MASNSPQVIHESSPTPSRRSKRKCEDTGVKAYQTAERELSKTSKRMRTDARSEHRPRATGTVARRGERTSTLSSTIFKSEDESWSAEEPESDLEDQTFALTKRERIRLNRAARARRNLKPARNPKVEIPKSKPLSYIVKVKINKDELRNLVRRVSKMDEIVERDAERIRRERAHAIGMAKAKKAFARFSRRHYKRLAGAPGGEVSGDGPNPDLAETDSGSDTESVEGPDYVPISTGGVTTGAEDPANVGPRRQLYLLPALEAAVKRVLALPGPGQAQPLFQGTQAQHNRVDEALEQERPEEKSASRDDALFSQGSNDPSAETPKEEDGEVSF